jgi:hypothetical protein
MSDFDPTALYSDLTAEQFRALHEGNKPTVMQNGDIKTGAVRLSWPALKEPQGIKGDPTSPKKYAGTLVFAHKKVEPIFNEVRRRISLEFPGVKNPDDMLDRFSDKSSIRDQSLNIKREDGGRGKPGLQKSSAGYRVHVPDGPEPPAHRRCRR